MGWYSRISHWFGLCPHCETYSTDEGIGGKCVDCGKVWGWVTRAELRAYAEKQTSRGAQRG
jgi:hypothetical protein